MKHLGPALVCCFAVCGCALSAEESFIGKTREDNCDGAVPVCSTTAGCRLGPENYTKVQMPGYRSFVVNTEGEADIVLQFFWKQQLSPGQDAEFTFYEPGCGEPHRQDVSGDEMFRQIGQDKQWQVVQTVYQEGDHLVEMRMDAQGTFLLKVAVITPDNRNKPHNSNDAPEPTLPGLP